VTKHFFSYRKNFLLVRRFFSLQKGKKMMQETIFIRPEERIALLLNQENIFSASVIIHVGVIPKML